jgi:hypothetical protein
MTTDRADLGTSLVESAVLYRRYGRLVVTVAALLCAAFACAVLEAAAWAHQYYKLRGFASSLSELLNRFVRRSGDGPGKLMAEDIDRGWTTTRPGVGRPARGRERDGEGSASAPAQRHAF